MDVGTLNCINLISASGPLRDAAEQTCLVWDLVVALWGKLKEDQGDEEGKQIVHTKGQNLKYHFVKKNWTQIRSEEMAAR